MSTAEGSSAGATLLHECWGQSSVTDTTHCLVLPRSLQTTVMREGELKKRPPFVLSPTRTTRHPLDMKQTIGDTQDLRILHYAERDEGFKERLARAARVEPAKPRLHYRAPMYRFRNLPEWAAEPAVALRRSVLRTNARLPPSLANLAYNTSSLATREAKRAVSRGSADGRARGHSVGASRGHSARPDVVARAASPQAPSPEFTGRLSLSRGAVRPRGPPSEGPSRPASPQRATLRSAAGGTRGEGRCWRRVAFPLSACRGLRLRVQL